MTMESSATTVEAAREPSAAEPPIFVADHPWRGRGVRAAVAIGAVLLVAWVVAIVAGALGFGSLPGLPLTGGASQAESAAPTHGAAGAQNAASGPAGAAAGRTGQAAAAGSATRNSTLPGARGSK